jgi:DNA mismatch repair ATPase MutS
MLDKATEQHWQAVKESYPDAIVFHEADGFYIVRGRDLDVLAKEFRVGSSNRWCGFDAGQACCYMAELVQRGYQVVRASNGSVAQVEPPADRTKELQRQRRKATYLAIEPRLLFDERGILQATNERWLTKHGYEPLLEQFKTWLRDGDSRSQRSYGELYIYTVADWYELDEELTSMLPNHALLLARAAFDTGSKLPCKLVEPKRRRERTVNENPQAAPAELQARFGQLAFTWTGEGEWG